MFRPQKCAQTRTQKPRILAKMNCAAATGDKIRRLQWPSPAWRRNYPLGMTNIAIENGDL